MCDHLGEHGHGVGLAIEADESFCQRKAGDVVGRFEGERGAEVLDRLFIALFAAVQRPETRLHDGGARVGCRSFLEEIDGIGPVAVLVHGFGQFDPVTGLSGLEFRSLLQVGDGCRVALLLSERFAQAAHSGSGARIELERLAELRLGAGEIALLFEHHAEAEARVGLGRELVDEEFKLAASLRKADDPRARRGRDCSELPRNRVRPSRRSRTRQWRNGGCHAGQTRRRRCLRIEPEYSRSAALRVPSADRTWSRAGRKREG